MELNNGSLLTIPPRHGKTLTQEQIAQLMTQSYDWLVLPANYDPDRIEVFQMDIIDEDKCIWNKTSMLQYKIIDLNTRETYNEILAVDIEEIVDKFNSRYKSVNLVLANEDVLLAEIYLDDSKGRYHLEEQNICRILKYLMVQYERDNHVPVYVDNDVARGIIYAMNPYYFTGVPNSSSEDN